MIKVSKPCASASFFSFLEKSGGYVTLPKLDEYQEKYRPIIDLGLETSPIRPTKEIEKPLRDRNPFKELAKYPKGPLQLKIQSFLLEGSEIQGLEPDLVVPDNNGSYDV